MKNQPNIIVRFSVDWWVYIFARGGALRGMVNGFEDSLAITGRFFLLVYLLYCGGKAGLFLAAPTLTIPAWLEILMFMLQVGGLEGSTPGLARRAEELRREREYEQAEAVQRNMLFAQIMTVSAVAEGALHLWKVDAWWLSLISGILMIARGWLIIGYLAELAKLESRGPQIISKAEYESMQKQKTNEDDEVARLREKVSQQEKQNQAANQQIMALLEQMSKANQQSQQSSKEVAFAVQQIAKQNDERFAQISDSISNQAANIERLSFPRSKESNVLSFPSKAPQQSTTISKEATSEGKDSKENDKEQERNTGDLLAVDPNRAAIITRVAASEALAHIEQEDISKVINAYLDGIGKSKIYQALRWGSSKHTNIVIPVIDIYLQISKEQQAVAN